MQMKALRDWTAPGIWVSSLAFSPDAKVLVSAAALDNVVRSWDVASGKEIRPAPGHSASVQLVRFASGNRELISLGEDRKVILWDLATGKEQHRLFDRQPFHSDTEVWTAAALSPDAKMMALGIGIRRSPENDYSIRLWDTTVGKEVSSLALHSKEIWSLAFAADGKSLASGGSDSKVCVWDLSTKKPRWSKELASPVRSVVFSPDTKWLATCDDSDRVCTWEVQSGRRVQSWEHDQTTSNRLVFTPDNQFLASSDGFSTIRVWSLDTGHEFLRLSEGPFCLAFSPTGRILAGGGMRHDDKPSGNKGRISTIQLWELVSGQKILSFEGDQESVDCLAFASHGRALASGGTDGTILLWDLIAGKVRQPGTKLDANDLDRLWAELGGEAPKAYQAIWTLTAAPEQAVTLLKQRLRPVAPADPQRLTRWIGDLNSHEFAIREQASKNLEDLAELAKPELRKCLQNQPPAEMRRRIEVLLQNLKLPVSSPHRLRAFRAIEILEQIGTPEAQQVVETLAKGEAKSRVTLEARITLERWHRSVHP